MAELWGVAENELTDIRKTTRDALTFSLTNTDESDSHLGEQVPTPARRWSEPGSVNSVGTPVRIGH